MDKNNRSKIDLLAHEVLAWRRQGKSYRSIEKLLKEEHGVKVSYRTVQAWLVRNHPELAEDQATAPPEKDDEDNASAPAQAQAERAQAPPPAEDLAALRAALDELAMKHRHLQARSAAQEAESSALTEQRPTPEVPPMPSLPVHVYSGSWAHDMPLLPGEPIDITPASRPRLLRSLLTLGVIAVLLALGLLAFYTVFQDTLARAYATARHAYVTVMHTHGPFALLAASMVIAGLGLGLRAKAFVPALLALAAYLLMLRNAHIPFFIAVVLTIQVSKALINDR
jgi:hypothetical protein